MKAPKRSFETNFWIRREGDSPFKVIDDFFQSDDLDHYKQLLGEVMISLRKYEVHTGNDAGSVFSFYVALRSLLSACYCLQFASKKWKVASAPGCTFILNQASLSREEYNDPCLVFRNAFATKTLGEFEAFFGEAVELALSHHTDDGYWDVMTFYIHLIKMLDATWLIRGRGVERIEKLLIIKNLK